MKSKQPVILNSILTSVQNRLDYYSSCYRCRLFIYFFFVKLTEQEIVTYLSFCFRHTLTHAQAHTLTRVHAHNHIGANRERQKRIRDITAFKICDAFGVIVVGATAVVSFSAASAAVAATTTTAAGAFVVTIYRR